MLRNARIDPQPQEVNPPDMKHTAKKLLLILSVVSTVSCDRGKQRQGREEALNDLQATKKEFADKIEMTDEGLSVDFDAIDEHNRKVNQAADKMGGKLGEAMKVVTSMQAEINRLSRECAEGADRFAEAVDWQTLAAKRDFEARRQQLRGYIDINEKTLAAYEKYPAEVTAGLDRIGFTGRERKDFEAGFQRSQRRTVGLVRTIRGCDIECAKVGISVLDRLERIGDAWTWNADGEVVEFEADEDLEWFQGEMEKFTALADKQIEAQGKFAEVLRGD